MNEPIDFFRSMSKPPFVVQFILRLSVEALNHTALQVCTYLITADSLMSARERAQAMIPSLNDSYRNSNGNVVHVSCVGIHSIEKLEYVDSDDTLNLACFQFSNTTTINDLIHEQPERNDLPPLSQ